MRSIKPVAKKSYLSLGAVASTTALIVFVLISGCSLFEKKNGNENSGRPPIFRPVAAATSNMVPIPAEIANEIQRLSRGEGEPLLIVEAPPASGTPDPVTYGESAVVVNSTLPASSPLPIKMNPKEMRQPNTDAQSKPIIISKDGKIQQYKVKPGDTLMKISFEMFGNLYRWKEIYEANRGKFADYKALPVGTVLTVYGVEYVVIERNGKPYLIKRNDTLKKISNYLYGSSEYWKDLWHNNPQLIRNPNQIYYGFTMYYQELNNRNLSSEKK